MGLTVYADDCWMIPESFSYYVYVYIYIYNKLCMYMYIYIYIYIHVLCIILRDNNIVLMYHMKMIL